MSLRSQMALTVGAIVALALTVGGIGAYRSTRTELRDEIDGFLRARTESFERSVDDGRFDGRAGPGRRDPRAVFGGLALTEADSITQIVGLDGGVVFSLDGADPLPVDTDTIDQVRRTGEPVFQDVQLAGGHHRMVTARFTDEAVSQVARSLAETDDAVRGVRNRLLALGLFTTVAAALLGWLTSRRVARPIEELADRAEQVARTQALDTPMNTAASGEVGRLAGSLTAMLEALDESRSRQQQLVMDAGHELRTPLTTLRTSVELLQRGIVSPEDEQRLLATIGEEIGELTDLVGEIVDLGTDAHRSEPPQRCDLLDVATVVANRANGRHQRTVTVVGMSAPLLGQPAMLERAVSNLVDNAVKFSPADSSVTIEVEPDRISVRDHGPGLSADDLPHLFDRFYRSTAARTLPGSGLGLAIVAQVAQAHGGATFARTADGEAGAIIGFTFLPNSDDSGRPF